MKKMMPCMLALVFAMAACNNNGKDSVAKADSTNSARRDTSQNQNVTTSVDEAGSTFMVNAANAGMTEVKLAQLAQEKATSSTVKEFAEMMVKDHSAANEKAKALAVQKNVALPATIGDEQQKLIDDMNKKNGKDFDKAYVDQMVSDHEKAVDLFQKASSNVTDADIKAFADNTLPTIKMHLDRIKEIKKNMK